nr:MAG TPA: hypothetical protein [Caudoviricetes sp.]
MALLDKDYCKGCKYFKGWQASTVKYCDYISITGKPRPCPAGIGCTAKCEAKPDRQVIHFAKKKKKEGV